MFATRVNSVTAIYFVPIITIIAQLYVEIKFFFPLYWCDDSVLLPAVLIHSKLQLGSVNINPYLFKENTFPLNKVSAVM